jgi:CRP-like cAMP-binding protein
MPIDDERNGHEILENPTPAEPAGGNAALGSRFDQMFPVLSDTEIGRIRRFGEVRRFPAGAFLFQAGEAVSGMYVILSGHVAIVPRDGLGQSVSVAAFAHLIGAPVEEMTEVVPGEVIAEIGQLSGRPDLSVIDARAVGDVEDSDVGVRVFQVTVVNRVQNRVRRLMRYDVRAETGEDKAPGIVRALHSVGRREVTE